MDSSMNDYISDQLHIAQQSRREKLRVQHCSQSRSGHQIHDYTSGLEIVQPIFNPDIVPVGDDMRNSVNIMYPVGGSSDMLNFSSAFCNNSRNGSMEDSADVNSINLVSSNVDSSLKHRTENILENCGVWKSLSPGSNANDWNTDCVARYGKKNCQGIASDVSAFEMRAKHDTTEHCQSQYQYGAMSSATQLHYQNALSDGVTTAVIELQPHDTVRGSTCISRVRYGGDNDQHVRNVPYGYQSDGVCLLRSSSWNTGMSSLNSRTNQMVADSQSQGLSLSLCSYPAGEVIFGNSHLPQSIQLHNMAGNAFQDSKSSSADFARTASVEQCSTLQESVGPSTNYHPQTGPLGPFTGYATILKSSRFLQPAHQLLDEYCSVIGKFASSSTRMVSDSNIAEFVDLATAVNSIVSNVVAAGDIMGSVATRQDSDEIMKRVTTSTRESLRPRYQANKAKLLHMLEEVSRMYKRYHQQMLMVVSAFESVAGLTGATPYISSALKTVSWNFSHLKNAISNQLRHIKTFLGEDFSLPHGGIRDKGDPNNKRLKYADHSFQKHKYGGSSMDLLEPQQHIWRLQRGLPESAVSVLRAWLFEHFLHPYPTDTDKHMLATQTGLTRSQVSNWFINARVRLWKPMVEEVHMLETKSVAERNRNAVGNADVSTNGVDVHLKADHSLNKMIGSPMASVNLECPARGSLYEIGNVCVVKQHDQEQHSRVDRQDMSSTDKGMLEISRYHQTGNESNGVGSISLTLGLRQSADQLNRLEGSHHQPYLQQQDRMRKHLGGHAGTHEYAG